MKAMKPQSGTWWVQELAEKQEILKAFWDMRIIQYNEERVEWWKKFIISQHFPKDSDWNESLEDLFQKAVSKQINFDVFFDALKILPLRLIKAINEVENLLPIASEAKSDKELNIEDEDVDNIQKYIIDKRMSASISLGSAYGKLVTPTFPENQTAPFSMHSVGKIFTGMLALVMVREGVLSEEDLNSPVKLDEEVIKALPPAVAEQLKLKKITLHQLMTHKAGMGDFNDKYFDALSKDPKPQIKRIEDFLPFAEEETYTIGEERYSNLGMVLVGLAIKHAYEKKHGPCEYNQILQKHIIDKVNMPSFTPWKPVNAKCNPNDREAPYIVGSPAGCYWSTAEDLAKFGQWIYQQYWGDQMLQKLIENYGQEFYKDRVISHGGNIDSASAFLSVSIDSGAVIAAMSDQPDLAFDLESRAQKHIVANQSKKMKIF